jgi:hypothetical protein
MLQIGAPGQIGAFKEMLNKLVCCVVRQACPERIEGLTTNVINYLRSS